MLIHHFEYKNFEQTDCHSIYGEGNFIIELCSSSKSASNSGNNVYLHKATTI